MSTSDPEPDEPTTYLPEPAAQQDSEQDAPPSEQADQE
jgi:hypothetical protein